MAETRTQHWRRRSTELAKHTKHTLCAKYRALGGLGGTQPPEKWRKDEVINSIVDIEWSRLPDSAKAEEHGPFDPPCETCGQSYQPHPKDHHYHYTHGAAPEAEWLCRACGKTQAAHQDQPATPEADQDDTPRCGRCGKTPADHLGWEQGHLFIRRMSYQDEPAEVQPPTGAGATATPECCPGTDLHTPVPRAHLDGCSADEDPREEEECQAEFIDGSWYGVLPGTARTRPTRSRPRHGSRGSRCPD